MCVNKTTAQPRSSEPSYKTFGFRYLYPVVLRDARSESGVVIFYKIKTHL